MKEAMFYTQQKDGKVRCILCPKTCLIQVGKTGFCGVRKNHDGRLYSENYGRISALHMDPVEKKPLRRFMPGTQTFSVGSYGCNMDCPWCQNESISRRIPHTMDFTPEQIVEEAMKQGVPSIAYTYNEPTVFYEWIYETARLAKSKGLKNIWVSNGYICEKPFRQILPFLDACNIDVKTFEEEAYRFVCKGSLSDVKRTVEIAASQIHVEITALMVTGIHDNLEGIENMCRWIAGIDRNIPLHLSRYYPQRFYKEPMTDRDKMIQAEKRAKEYLTYVYLGNL